MVRCLDRQGSWGSTHDLTVSGTALQLPAAPSPLQEPLKRSRCPAREAVTSGNFLNASFGQELFASFLSSIETGNLYVILLAMAKRRRHLLMCCLANAYEAVQLIYAWL